MKTEKKETRLSGEKETAHLRNSEDQNLPENEKHSWGRDLLSILLVTLIVTVGLRVFVVEAYQIPSGSMEPTLQVGDFIVVNKFVYGATTPRNVPFTSTRVPFLRLPAISKPERGEIVVFESPGDGEDPLATNGSKYVKRCFGLPGDTVEIRDKVVLVNGKEVLPISDSQVNVNRIRSRHFPDGRIFPRGYDFNEDNYGPIVVPYAGMKTDLHEGNISSLKQIIRQEGHNVTIDDEGKILIDDAHAGSYVVKSDYYFTLGDNRDNSMDSRFWGYVPDTHLIGRAMFVYWSLNESTASGVNLGPLESVRWDRFGKLIR